MMKRTIVGSAVAGALLILSATGCATTPAITDERGRALPRSIAELEAVEIGGMEQWVLIRGTDRSNPVLLWLHGGPGAAHMPIAGGWAAELEEHFVVVHWDQRGAGKSNPPDFDESTMRLERYVRDVHEMTAWLQQHLGQERIYLIGHSWGSELALHVLQERPENYVAYVGVAQVVNRELASEIAYRRIGDALEEEGNARDRRRLRRLQELGPPPYRDHSRYVEFMGIVNDHGGSYDVGFASLAVRATRAPEYRFRDYRAWLRGANRGSGPMWAEPAYRDFDARREVPRLEVPVFFIMGERDLNTPLEAVRSYYEVLDAPRGKELIVFEEAAHTPFFQDEERFVNVLVEIRDR
ncbi:MAG: alpha/beta hydrolase [Spirochaetaceae bacterium]|nr:MAG: alpha/beta hydrolase [Spirochaetaceae bacterium]